MSFHDRNADIIRARTFKASVGISALARAVQ